MTNYGAQPPEPRPYPRQPDPYGRPAPRDPGETDAFGRPADTGEPGEYGGVRYPREPGAAAQPGQYGGEARQPSQYGEARRPGEYGSRARQPGQYGTARSREYGAAGPRPRETGGFGGEPTGRGAPLRRDAEEPTRWGASEPWGDPAGREPYLPPARRGRRSGTRTTLLVLAIVVLVGGLAALGAAFVLNQRGDHPAAAAQHTPPAPTPAASGPQPSSPAGATGEFTFSAVGDTIVALRRTHHPTTPRASSTT